MGSSRPQADGASVSSMNVGDLVRAMEAIAPVRFAASWDNVGLIAGDLSSPLARVLLTIDCTAEVLSEARRERVDAVVSYHPPVFEPQKTFLAGSMAFEAIRAGIALYSPHTALDVADGGTNDVLGDALAMTSRAPLRESPADPSDAPSTEPLARRGFGRVGSIQRASVATLVERVKGALSIERVLVAGPLDRDVERVAVCAGSGGDLLPEAIAAGVHLFLTGELRHHDALRGAAAGLTLVCALHSSSERAALVSLERQLAARLPGTWIGRSSADREPFVFI
jgi:dinuclear metal center YbgI/SA1388 family protein